MKFYHLKSKGTAHYLDPKIIKGLIVLFSVSFLMGGSGGGGSGEGWAWKRRKLCPLLQQYRFAAQSAKL